jgi:hypothetical protein
LLGNERRKVIMADIEAGMKLAVSIPARPYQPLTHLTFDIRLVLVIGRVWRATTFKPGINLGRQAGNPSPPTNDNHSASG